MIHPILINILIFVFEKVNIDFSIYFIISIYKAISGSDYFRISSLLGSKLNRVESKVLSKAAKTN